MTCVIGVTTHLEGDDYAKARRTYARAIVRAGGLPVYLPPPSEGEDVAVIVEGYLDVVDGLVFTGGDDPRMEQFGGETDSRVTPVHEDRQGFELELMKRARERDVPSLGVCLGMQYMGLMAGATFYQWLPDELEGDGADDHWGDNEHMIEVLQQESGLENGMVTSHHRQGLGCPGSLRVVAVTSEGLVEAFDDPELRFWVGVQWHPERTGAGALGDGLFEALIKACKETKRDD